MFMVLCSDNYYKGKFGMKKAVALFLCLIAVLGLVACSGDTVKVEIPALFLNEQELSNLDEYASINGYLSAEYNQKSDTVTLKMTKFSYDLQLTSMGMTVLKSLNEMVESDTFPYLKSIDTYSDDFSEITVLVDAEAYNADSTRSLLSMSVGETALMYGVYTTKKKPTCTVTVKDAKTGSVLEEKTVDSAEQ